MVSTLDIHRLLERCNVLLFVSNFVLDLHCFHLNLICFFFQIRFLACKLLFNSFCRSYGHISGVAFFNIFRCKI